MSKSHEVQLAETWNDIQILGIVGCEAPHALSVIYSWKVSAFILVLHFLA